MPGYTSSFACNWHTKKQVMVTKTAGK